ncbi:MAG: FkbM family methyltransferase [Candidatus Omnitrophica bacterium]|nr:FkbM family methyltransferase [Candidatus Omnitrophota bacterium]
MSLLIKFKQCFKSKDLYLVKEVIKNVINWPVYFLDFFSLVTNKTLIFYMKNSLKYMVRAKTWDRGIITRVHLADDYNLNQLSLRTNSIVIDIGAHIGIFSTFISSKAGKIYAYEPVPDNYKLLEENIKLNNLEYKVKPFNFAISDKKENLKIFLSEINTAGHSIYCDSKNYIEAAAKTLAEVFDENNIDQCDLLKIDCEGCEYQILFGLPKDYFSKIKRIYLEYHEFKSSDAAYNHESLIKLLKDNGFSVTQKETILFAENKSINK